MKRIGLRLHSVGHLSGCWFGPPEDRAQIEHAVRRWTGSSGVLRLEEPYPFAIPMMPGMEPPRAPGEALEGPSVCRPEVMERDVDLAGSR